MSRKTYDNWLLATDSEEQDRKPGIQTFKCETKCPYATKKLDEDILPSTCVPWDLTFTLQGTAPSHKRTRHSGVFRVHRNER